MKSQRKLDTDYDVLIIGAGPAGITLALHLSGKGVKTAILDKERFPRSKICGDALGGKVINVLKRIPGRIFEDFQSSVEKHPSSGIRFYSPQRLMLAVPFPVIANVSTMVPGYVCRRELFDNFMAGHLRNTKDIEFFEGVTAERVVREPGRMIVHTTRGPLSAKLVVGADGVNSIVRKSLAIDSIDAKHICIGLRGYYSGISYPEGDNFIELHFLRSLLPGYLWLFPGPGGVSNVGIGMLKSKVISERVNMISRFRELIASDPILQMRFGKAVLLGKLEAHSLSMGTMPLKRYGDRFLLLGDAGFMVDPFSGEGIGNAMGSAESAVPVILDSFKKGDFSSAQLAEYQHRITKRFENEFRIMGIMQKLVRIPALMNLVVRKAARNEELRMMLSSMFTQQDIRSKLTRPGFYIKLLMK